jgi:hypothetical protein
MNGSCINYQTAVDEYVRRLTRRTRRTHGRERRDAAMRKRR